MAHPCEDSGTKYHRALLEFIHNNHRLYDTDPCSIWNVLLYQITVHMSTFSIDYSILFTCRSRKMGHSRRNLNTIVL